MRQGCHAVKMRRPTRKELEVRRPSVVNLLIGATAVVPLFASPDWLTRGQRPV
jgi:hypothetical protein